MSLPAERGDGPSDAALLERSYSLANEAMFTVALQVRHLRSSEPEDDQFVFRWWADLQFLIIALRRLRRAALLASRINGHPETIRDAIHRFDEALPGLGTMRNVGEHIDAYGIDDPKRHHKAVTRRHLQSGSWDGVTFTWLANKHGLPLRLNIDTAQAAAHELFTTVRDIRTGSTGAPRKSRG